MFFQVIYDNFVEKIEINRIDLIGPRLESLNIWFFNPISNEMEWNYTKMIPLDIPPPIPDYSEHEIEKMRKAEEKRERKRLINRKSQ